MGGCSSALSGSIEILDRPDGDKDAFDARFTEDRVLGEGEFGQVKLVYEKQESATKTMYACKTLRKGAVFKDNTLYPPLPPEVLRGEIDMLRTLAGEYYCMKLVAVYETNKALLLVTDCYQGGEMMEYVSKQKEDLRTEDISRIAFQLFSAVNHCARNNIIHRDIKPENAMFVSEDPGAELRLIDFGSGTSKVVEGMHTTFAGTPFYNSPEMFQKTYTNKTDVWSVGVVLYVLVAGYPADCLQKAFNILLDSKRTSLKKLPGMPDDMPDSYYEMLEEALQYKHKSRKSAGEILESDFVKFHKDLEEEGKDTFEQLELPSPRQERMRRTSSIAVRGSVKRHSLFLDFQKYERSLTTILATMLSRDELKTLLSILEERYESGSVNAQLQVVVVNELKDIIRLEVNNEACVGILESLENESASVAFGTSNSSYGMFSYHFSMLKEFAPKETAAEKKARRPSKNLGSMQKQASVWRMKKAPARKPSLLDPTETDNDGSIEGGKNINIGHTMHAGRTGASAPPARDMGRKTFSVFL